MTKTIAFIMLILCTGADPATQPQAARVTPESVEANLKAQYDEIDRYLERQVKLADASRKESWKRDFASIEAYEKSVDPWRERLWELLGGKHYAPAPLEPREELLIETARYRAYRVWFGAFEDVRTYGILMVPRGEGPFPAVICIHGLAGTPESLCGLTQRDYHHNLGERIVERGYVVFAPLDINRQDTRLWLDRKAILVGERLQALEQFKAMRVVDYLAAREDVDAKRIGAYGISWGGRTVMNLAALDRRVAACVISGFFNDLIPKMITPSPHYKAYIEVNEGYAFFYNHFAWFNDADVVSLICPRPVFIEQGNRDRAAWWERSQAAFEQVKAIYNRLGIGERAEYSIFGGPHEIHAVESLVFLDKWLKGK